MALNLNKSRIAIVGGTGSLGKRIISRLSEFEPELLRIFSRDEKKQTDMRRSLYKVPNIEFYIGNIRDQYRVREALSGIDIVINTAALKHVPICEEYPIEAVQTNILGAINIRREALFNNVDSVISICTDKAVKPVNVLGMTKAIQERISLLPVPDSSSTRFISVRYGNVLGSRGSVLPIFRECINNDNPIPITDSNMTRFIITLDQAVDTILFALEFGFQSDVWIRKSPAIYIQDLGKALAMGLKQKDDYPTKIIGIRPGEKIHEVLVSSEEACNTLIKGEYYCISKKQNGGTPVIEEYCSQNERKLTLNEIETLLIKEGWL